MSCICSRALVALGVSVLPLAAAARDADPRPPARAEPEIGPDTLSVTATKTAAPPIDTLAGTSVVTRAQVERLQPSRLSAVLRDVPGATTQENPSDPAQAINIRGLQDFGRVNVLIDGARQDFQTSGHGPNGVFYLDPELVGGVDITRGPSATIYGSGAIGGVAAFRTRSIDDILKPDESAGFVQKHGFGTKGQRFVNSSALGARTGTAADVFGQFVFRNTAPCRDGLGSLVPDTGSELTAGLAKLTVRPADGHEIRGTALLQRFDFANGGSGTAGARFANAVQADTYTLGYGFARPDVPLINLSLNAYATTTRDALTFLRDCPRGVYGRLGTRAGDRLTHDWGRGFLTLAASHIDGRDRATRESLLTVPPDRLSTTLGFRVLGVRLTVGSRLTLLVDARTDLPASARSRATKAYGLVDLFANHDVNDRIRADVIVQNALDKRQRPYLDALASPGLVAKFALSVTFATR